MSTERKLNDGDVAIIRQRLAEGENARLLANEYGVSRAFISMIKNGKKRQPSLHRVSLESGGYIVISTQIDIFALSESDKAFVDGLIEYVRTYKRPDFS